MGQRLGLGGEETPTEGLGMEHPEKGEDRAGNPGSEGGRQGSKPTLCGGSVLQGRRGAWSGCHQTQEEHEWSSLCAENHLRK